MQDVATIDLPYIEKNKSRHRTVRYYFRYQGQRLCRLPDDPDTQAFSDAYWKARAQIEGGGSPIPAKPKALPGRPAPKSFHALCVAYLKSDPYRALDASTQAARRRVIDGMLLEPVKIGGGDLFADMPAKALTVPNIQRLRDRKSASPFAADERLKVLTQIFETTDIGRDGKPHPIMPVNFARFVRRFRKKTEGHHTITPDEIGRYIKHHGLASKAVLALALLMYLGFRVSDLQAIGPRHRRSDVFLFRMFKGRNRQPKTLEVAIHPMLDHILSLHKVTGLYYMMTEYGDPYSIKGLSQRVSKWFSQAGLEHCTAHTVRKGLAVNVADNEATDSMMDSLFGWSDGKTSKIYTARKSQSRLARKAVAIIDWGDLVWGESANELPHLGEGTSVPTATPRDISQ